MFGDQTIFFYHYELMLFRSVRCRLTLADIFRVHSSRYNLYLRETGET